MKTPKYKFKQKVKWHNDTENGEIVSWNDESVVVKWEGAGVLVHTTEVAELYIKYDYVRTS